VPSEQLTVLQSRMNEIADAVNKNDCGWVSALI
jgi:hypothetical protein